MLLFSVMSNENFELILEECRSARGTYRLTAPPLSWQMSLVCGFFTKQIMN